MTIPLSAVSFLYSVSRISRRFEDGLVRITTDTEPVGPMLFMKSRIEKETKVMIKGIVMDLDQTLLHNDKQI